MSSSSLVATIHEKYGCCRINKFSEGRCSIILPKSKNAICLSGTRLQKHRHGFERTKLCDIVVHWENQGNPRFCAAIELKGGGVNVSGAVDQLQAGADLIWELSHYPHRFFRPLLVKRSLNTFQMRELSRAAVLYGGKKIKIELMNCGDSLESILR